MRMNRPISLFVFLVIGLGTTSGGTLHFVDAAYDVGEQVTNMQIKLTPKGNGFSVLHLQLPGTITEPVGTEDKQMLVFNVWGGTKATDVALITIDDKDRVVLDPTFADVLASKCREAGVECNDSGFIVQKVEGTKIKGIHTFFSGEEPTEFTATVERDGLTSTVTRLDFDGKELHPQNRQP